jgi:uncharacterized membrane protein YgaE (UPF0421/DUF939 family)
VAARVPARRRAGESLARLRAARWAILQTAGAAGAAWYVAHDLLGHAQPFFAPIAAAVSLGAVSQQRGRRALQMILGVCIGIGVGEGLHALLGTGVLSIAVVTLVTLNVAVAVGWGFVGQGMMFVNQAAASAILVIALRRSGTGSERFVDALVGGVVALIVSQLLFPPEPLKLLRGAQRRTLAVLGDTFDELVDMLELGRRVDASWMLRRSESVHRALAALLEARSSARDITRLTRRRPARAAVEAEDRRAAHLALLANDLLSLLRVSIGQMSAGDEGSLPDHETEAIRILARAVRRLDADADQALGLAQRAAAAVGVAAAATPREAVVAQLVSATVRDVRRVAGDQSSVAAPQLAATG